MLINTLSPQRVCTWGDDNNRAQCIVVLPRGRALGRHHQQQFNTVCVCVCVMRLVNEGDVCHQCTIGSHCLFNLRPTWCKSVCADVPPQTDNQSWPQQTHVRVELDDIHNTNGCHHQYVCMGGREGEDISVVMVVVRLCCKSVASNEWQSCVVHEWRELGGNLVCARHSTPEHKQIVHSNRGLSARLPNLCLLAVSTTHYAHHQQHI